MQPRRDIVDRALHGRQMVDDRVEAFCDARALGPMSLEVAEQLGHLAAGVGELDSQSLVVRLQCLHASAHPLAIVEVGRDHPPDEVLALLEPTIHTLSITKAVDAFHRHLYPPVGWFVDRSSLRRWVFGQPDDRDSERGDQLGSCQAALDRGGTREPVSVLGAAAPIEDDARTGVAGKACMEPAIERFFRGGDDNDVAEIPLGFDEPGQERAVAHVVASLNVAMQSTVAKKTVAKKVVTPRDRGGAGARARTALAPRTARLCGRRSAAAAARANASSPRRGRRGPSADA